MGLIWDICHIRDTLNVDLGVQTRHVTNDTRTCLLTALFFVGLLQVTMA
jgi:hypothetical protein